VAISEMEADEKVSSEEKEKDRRIPRDKIER
jgi:hypothetical protein